MIRVEGERVYQFKAVTDIWTGNIYSKENSLITTGLLAQSDGGSKCWYGGLEDMPVIQAEQTVRIKITALCASSLAVPAGRENFVFRCWMNMDIAKQNK
jgi:hypothetical protein